MNYGNRSKKRLFALTAITVIAIASVLTVYAVTIGTFTGGEVVVGVVGSSTVTYSADNNATGSWTTTLAPSSVSDPWYSRLEVPGDYSGPVTITWQLQQKTDTDTWGNVTSSTTNMVLSGSAQDAYASTDGGNTGNYNWSTDITTEGTYRVVATVESN